MAFRFLQFRIYKSARAFYTEIAKIAGTFPTKEQFVLTSQLLRAALSILLNIAEGSDRNSDKDFNHFLTIAHGSLNEVVAALDVALVRGYIDHSQFDSLFEAASQLSKQLATFRRTLTINAQS